MQGFEHRTTQQLFDERCGHPVGALDDFERVGVGELQRDGVAVQGEQSFARVGVWEVDLDRDVDPAGTRQVPPLALELCWPPTRCTPLGSAKWTLAPRP